MRKIVRSVFAVCTVVTVFSLLGSEEEKKRGWSVLSVVENGISEIDGVDSLTEFVVSPDYDDKENGHHVNPIELELAPVDPEKQAYQTWLQLIPHDNVKGRWPALLKDMHRHNQLDKEDHDYVIDQLSSHFCGDFDPTADYTPPQKYDISLNGQLIALYYRIGYQFLYPKEKRLQKDKIDINFAPHKMMLLLDSTKKWHKDDHILITQTNNGLNRQHPDSTVALALKPASLEVWRKKRMWSGCGWEEYWDRKCFDGAIEQRPTNLVCDKRGKRTALLFGGQQIEVYNIEPGARNDKRAQQIVSGKKIERVIFTDKAQTLTTVHSDNSATVFKWNKRKKEYRFSDSLLPPS